MPDTPDRVAELLAWWDGEGKHYGDEPLCSEMLPPNLLALAKLGAAAIRRCEAKRNYGRVVDRDDASVDEVATVATELREATVAYTATRQEICNAK